MPTPPAPGAADEPDPPSDGAARRPRVTLVLIAVAILAIGLATWALDRSSSAGDVEAATGTNPASVDREPSSPQVSCKVADRCERWRVPVRGPTAEPLVATDGSLIVATNGDLLGVRPDSGEPDWRREHVLQGEPLTLDGGLAASDILMVTSSRELIAIDPQTGEDRWRTNSPVSTGASLDHLVTAGELHLLAFTEPGGQIVVTAHDADTGDLRWEASGRAAALDPDGVLLRDRDGLVGLAVEDGEPRWSSEATPRRFGTAVEGMVPIETGDEVHMLDVRTGDQVAALVGRLAGGTDQATLVRAAAPDAGLRAISPDGTVRWEVTAEATDACCGRVLPDDDGVLLIGDDPDGPYAVLDPDDGEMIHERRLDTDGEVVGLLGRDAVQVEDEGRRSGSSSAVSLVDGEVRWETTGGRVETGLEHGFDLVILDGEAVAVEHGRQAYAAPPS